MKPKIGAKIYVIMDSATSIVKQYVFFLGKESFMPSANKEFYDGDYNFEQFYDEYGKTWFTTLKQTKEYLSEYYTKYYEENTKVRIYKDCEDLWEVVER